MNVKLLTEHHLEFLSLKEAAQALMSLHLSNCHIVGNHMPRLINNDISLTVMLNKRHICIKKIYIHLYGTGLICLMKKSCYFFNCQTTGIQKVDHIM